MQIPPHSKISNGGFPCFPRMRLHFGRARRRCFRPTLGIVASHHTFSSSPRFVNGVADG